MSKEIDKRENIRVVTKNEFITADGLSQLSLNARKLLYLAIAQCQMQDREFYEYSATPEELAEMWGVSRQRVYQSADSITDELMRLFIKTVKEQGKHFIKRTVFRLCEYDDDNKITFKLDGEMGELLLKITGGFTQPPLSDFLKMRSKYSMAVWHLMQREMGSTLPGVGSPMEFDLTLEELRQVTNTQDKLEPVAQFKRKVLNVAIKEIKENLLADITYMDLKRGKRITGFRFTAQNIFGTIHSEELTLRERKIVRKAQLVNRKAEGTITTDEMIELQQLQEELYQMELEDYFGKHRFQQ